MRICAAVIASLSIGSAGALAGAPNELLYIQGPASGLGLQSSAVNYGALAERHADSVPAPGLPLPSRVHRIDWWGGSLLPSGGVFDNIVSFNIRAYHFADNSLLYNQDISVGSIDTEVTGLTIGPQNSSVHRYSFQSDSSLFFGAEVGMISIAANYTFEPGFWPYFLWANSFEGDEVHYRDAYNGMGYQPWFGDAAFALYGVVPAPGAAVLFGVVGAALGSRRRR